MKTKVLIAHRYIIDYLENKLNDQSLKKINDIREKDPGYALLFQLIDFCKTKKQITEINQYKNTTFSFSKTEQLLLNLLSGNPEPADAEYFLILLYESPDFYSRLMLKLTAINKSCAVNENDLREIRIKTNAELIAEMSAFIKSSHPSLGSAVITKINSLKKFFLIKNDRQTNLRYSLVTVALVLFCLVGYLVLKPDRIRHDIYNKYFNNNAVTLAFDSTLRGPLVMAGQNTSYDTMFSQIKLGVGDYLRQKYTTALSVFEQILSQQEEIQNGHFYPLLREAYFYSGLSCLALAGESRFKKQIFLNKASTYLHHAVELSVSHNQQGSDREYFFLSLTYDLLGEKQLALEQIGQIPADSPYKSDSEKLKDLIIHKDVKHK
ncbi:hypothetical protein JXQ31_15900 [candidate division KSB1 bacterium]|nr:hypothetical protein [candidate division KSB1 bacterium]